MSWDYLSGILLGIMVLMAMDSVLGLILLFGLTTFLIILKREKTGIQIYLAIVVSLIAVWSQGCSLLIKLDNVRLSNIVMLFIITYTCSFLWGVTFTNVNQDKIIRMQIGYITGTSLTLMLLALIVRYGLDEKEFTNAIFTVQKIANGELSETITNSVLGLDALVAMMLVGVLGTLIFKGIQSVCAIYLEQLFNLNKYCK